MAEGEAATASGQSGPGSGTASHLPWHLIPSFEPGETDLQDYAKRLSFLAGLWPSEHLSQLAPRAALMCKGSSFQKVMRIQPEKLKVNSDNGVKLLVETLGGVWGETSLEDRYEKFERAMFGLSQKSDESNESYIARHEVIFEELVSQNVSFKDIRAYLLLRNSNLTADDKKRVIVESGGDLQYSKVTTAIKFLGAKFFHEVQGQQKNYKSKTYDVNYTQDGEEDALYGEEHPTFTSMDNVDLTDGMIEQLLSEGDEDALVVAQFEDALIDSLQSDGEMCAFVNTYLEARQKLTEKSKSRGFWPVRSGGKSFGKKGKGKGGPFGHKGRKPLAVRIAESHCRICLQKGHWKAECPRRAQAASNSTAGSKTQTANVMVPVGDELSDDEDADVYVMETMDDLNVSEKNPDKAIRDHQLKIHIDQAFTCSRHKYGDKILYNQVRGKIDQHLKQMPSATTETRIDLSDPVRSKTPSVVPKQSPSEINPCVVKVPVENQSRASPEMSKVKTKDVLKHMEEHIHFATTNATGILDLGASQSVMGAHQVDEFLQCLPQSVQDKVFEKPVNMSFRFGNNSVVPCSQALFVPIDKFWIKIAIVKSKTPFLISNNVCRSLGAVIDTELQTIHFKALKCTMPLALSRKRLFLLDISSLLDLRPPHSTDVKQVTAENVLTCTEQSVASSVSNIQSAEPVDKAVEAINQRLPNPEPRTEVVVKANAATLHDPSQIDSQLSANPCVTQSCEVSHVGHRPCSSLCSSADLRQPPSRSQVPEDEHGAVEESNCEIRDGQSRDEVYRPGGERPKILSVVPQDMELQQQDGTSRTDPLPNHVDRTEGTGEHGAWPDDPSTSSKAKSSSSQHHPHRPGGGRRGGALGCSGQPTKGSIGSGCEPAGAALGDSGIDHGRSGEPASCTDSPAEPIRGISQVTSPAETDFLTKCIHENNSFLESLITSEDQIMGTQHVANWVHEEMIQYMASQGFDPDKKHTPLIDVLEVYCSADSQLTKQCLRRGLRAMRF